MFNINEALTSLFAGKPNRNVGENITYRLHLFNNWRDDFLIELSTLLLMIGFIMGTVDVLTRGGVATAQWFTLSWAIVQAVAIDGLFFAVWGKIARSKWQKGYRLRMLAMIFVGVVLATVAILVNDILSYQQLANIADSLTAMNSLHIDSSFFVHTRAILVVAVALLVQLFCRGASPAQGTPIAASVAIATTIAEERSPSRVARNRSHSPSKGTSVKAIPQHATIDHSLDVATPGPQLSMIEQGMYDAIQKKPGEAIELARLHQEQGLDAFTATLQGRYSQYASYITPARVANVVKYMEHIKATHSPQGDTVAIEEGSHGPAIIALNDGLSVASIAVSQQGHREKIKATWLRFVQEGRAINFKDIAHDANVGYSTVKKWASSIREEIEQELRNA